MNVESEHVLEAFKASPVIVALLLVIFLLFWLLKSKDTALNKLIEVSRSDSERYGKLITLLEILVNRKEN
jgi:predicted PurR-regulated permease PerM